MTKLDFNNLSDEKLVELSKKDERCSEVLITRFKAMVISLSRKFYLQGGELDDLISEGMIGLYRAITTYDPNKQVMFSTFAYVCVSRQLQNVIKSSLSKKNQAFSDYVSIDNREVIVGGVNPEELFLYKEGEAKINSLLREELSVFEYQVLSKYLDGLSYKEIAEKFNTDNKKVDNALSRARKKLASILK